MNALLRMRENLRLALESISNQRIRSLLNISGVVIGITALVAVTSVLVGLDRDLRRFLAAYGTDTLFIARFEPGIRLANLSREERTRKPLSLDDALAIKTYCPAVKEVAAEIYANTLTESPPRSARYQRHEVGNVNHFGALPSYILVHNAGLEDGRFFTEAEDLHRADVVILGHALAETFFPNERPSGKTILVASVPYRVLGVLEKSKGQLFQNQAADRAAIVPYHTYKKHHPADDETLITVQPYTEMKAAAKDQIRALLRQRREVLYDKTDNFSVSSAEEIARQFHQIVGAVAVITVLVSSIGLLVGGIGIMNTMLISVTERTREIGVRMAIGARRTDLIAQFLTESITLTGAGGITGVLVTFLMGLLLNRVLPSLPFVVAFWSVAASVLGAMSIGVFFGSYPAMRAARLNPVEALRHE